MSSLHAEALVRHGLSEDRVAIEIPGSDPEMFQYHERVNDGMVGLCSAYYPRKSPERILAIVRRMPHRQFLLVGKDWDHATAEFLSLPNFHYVECPYEAYPNQYARMSVFLSPSRLEGGPIPLLEAMMSNVVPVATRTGFAPDVIEHGRNGFLFEPMEDSSIACELIDRAFSMRTDIRRTVEHLTWERYSKAVESFL
jgi:glycosyltransferase involved in cell wall biosynthesis